ncbi:hypothetical protein JOS77_17260 [Chromobacterium haemolyticum]|nr:hypothetical protein JOS77_17260 [Chromobacterium haemolyticum]
MQAALWWSLEFPRGLYALSAEQWRIRRQWLRSGCFHGAAVWRGRAPWPDKLRRVLTRAGADWLALCFDDSHAAEALLGRNAGLSPLALRRRGPTTCLAIERSSAVAGGLAEMGADAVRLAVGGETASSIGE